jgi:hypothetical protein
MTAVLQMEDSEFRQNQVLPSLEGGSEAPLDIS